jgi:hypothetical protein
MNQEQISFNTSDIFHPTLSSMKVSNYASKEEIEQAKKLVNSLDFFQQNEKLMTNYNWPSDKVIETEAIYKDWLVLHAVYDENIALAPNEDLDDYWHMHILDTQKYMKDCQHVFGKYLHHYPYFGLTEVETQDLLNRGYELTQELFLLHFGYELTGGLNKCAATGCR